MPISIVIVDPNFWSASALFNPNAFPDRVKEDAAACGDRLGILTHSAEVVTREPGLNRALLLRQLRENRAFGSFQPPADKPTVIIFHNPSFLSGLYATLISVKSLLDLYARLVAKLIVPSASVFGFNSGQFQGRNVSGGRFLSWLESSTPREFKRRQDLISVFMHNLDEWLERAVAYRDSVVHDGEVPGLREAMLPFTDEAAHLRESDIVLPMMPDGQPVSDYCSAVVERVRALVAETLLVLPNVDSKLLSFGANASGLEAG
jgi:hypothetical protein